VYLATSDAKSDVGFLLGDPSFLLGRRNFPPILLSYRDLHFVLFGFFGFLGYLATSGAKSDVIFLLSDLISYKGDEIPRLSRLIFEI